MKSNKYQNLKNMVSSAEITTEEMKNDFFSTHNNNFWFKTDGDLISFFRERERYCLFVLVFSGESLFWDSWRPEVTEDYQTEYYASKSHSSKSRDSLTWKKMEYVTDHFQLKLKIYVTRLISRFSGRITWWALHVTSHASGDRRQTVQWKKKQSDWQRKTIDTISRLMRRSDHKTGAEGEQPRSERKLESWHAEEGCERVVNNVIPELDPA